MAAGFLAILPFLNAMRLKKLERAVSLRFPMGLAALRNAVFCLLFCELFYQGSAVFYYQYRIL